MDKRVEAKLTEFCTFIEKKPAELHQVRVLPAAGCGGRGCAVLQADRPEHAPPHAHAPHPRSCACRSSRSARSRRGSARRMSGCTGSNGEPVPHPSLPGDVWSPSHAKRS